MIADRTISVAAVLLASALPPLVLSLALHIATPRAVTPFAVRLASPTPGIADLAPILAGTTDVAKPAEPGLGPSLIGVAGRLPGDAVALVQMIDGSTHTLRLNDTVEGWRLVALDADAATFVRAGERIRSDLPPAP